MSIISTNHKLVGVQNGGTVSGAVRYDVQQDLTEAEQLQARKNIGIKGLGQEYSAGNNIDITDHVISVTGKKLLTIDDVSMTATQTDNTINIGVNNDYYQNLTQIAVDNAVEEIITEGRVLHEVYHDNSLTGNGNDKPLGLANDYALESEFEALQGDVENIDNRVTTINNEVDQNIIDISSLSAQNISLDVRVASNTSNITTNTTNISTVTRKADDTWQYIVDHESVWGASLNVNNPLTGNGSTASPLGINALKIDATLTGDGYNTKIGLRDNYALQSNLNTTNQTVLSHSDEIYNLGNDLYECQQDIESNASDISAVSGKLVTIYNTGRGGINSYSAIYFTDMYDNLGNGKEVHINRGRPDGTTSTVECGYTVSELGRKNAEICSDKVAAHQVNNGNSSNTTKLWYQPYNGDTSQKGFFEGSITFYVNEANRSISVMPLKISSGYDTNSWNPGRDVISLGSYVVGHPITVPFCWKASGIYGIGIKGSYGSTSGSITVNNYYVKYKEK